MFKQQFDFLSSYKIHSANHVVAFSMQNQPCYPAEQIQSQQRDTTQNLKNSLLLCVKTCLGFPEAFTSDCLRVIPMTAVGMGIVPRLGQSVDNVVKNIDLVSDQE